MSVFAKYGDKEGSGAEGDGESKDRPCERESKSEDSEIDEEPK